MIKDLIRFIFLLGETIFAGLTAILFDNLTVTGNQLNCKRRPKAKKPIEIEKKRSQFERLFNDK